ncbi:MAG: DNA repair protein RecN [Clostridia bacterium]|nr:DNA repair protein RecN [Clostridia bacterium]
MLAKLKIENIAIIELADIDFENGFNVMTGETGAGKSIIIDSINAVTGERTSKELIRTGAESGKVTAVFEDTGSEVAELLENMGIECDGTVVISRTIKKDGRNICSVNGTPTTVSMLKGIGSHLINIHGQHDSQSLLQPENHCLYIDDFGGNGSLISKYAQSYSELLETEAQIKSIDTDEQQKARRIDMLTYQINELEEADIEVGEKDALTSRRNFLRNAQGIIDALTSAYESLMADGGGVDSISDAAYELENAAGLYDGAADVSERITNAKYEIEDCCEEIRGLISQAECDPEELEEIEERLDLLRRLSSKYGATEEQMLEFLDNAKAELESITLSEERLEALEQKRKVILAKTQKLADELTKKRQRAGEQLSKQICAQLKFLDMPNVRFTAERKAKPLSPDGADEIEFLISPNVGEEPKPLAKIASGGELSRIMLAIKNVLTSDSSNETMIFDEIDTGVSGSAARKIAEKLKEVSQGRQVICVTHLAQIAAKADCHFLINKFVKNNKTYTKVTHLDYNGRTEELARIMGAGDDNSAFIKSAQELLKKS